MPPDKVHVGCQVGKSLASWCEKMQKYTAEPEKKSKQGEEETQEESTARHSSPKAWVIAVIPVPDAFAPRHCL